MPSDVLSQSHSIGYKNNASKGRNKCKKTIFANLNGMFCENEREECSIDESGTDAACESRQKIKQRTFVAGLFLNQSFDVDQDEWKDGRIAEAIERVGDGND